MNLRHILTTLACIAALPLASIAGTTEDAAKKAVVTISLKDMPVAQVLQRMETLTTIRVHYTAPAKDPVINLQLKDTTAAAVFDYVATLAQLEVIYQDDGVHFAPKK